MTDVQTATNMEPAASPQFEAARERRFPLGGIMCVALAVTAQVLWLGALGGWLLNLF
jgi:hypothetical protein